MTARSTCAGSMRSSRPSPPGARSSVMTRCRWPSVSTSVALISGPSPAVATEHGSAAGVALDGDGQERAVAGRRAVGRDEQGDLQARIAAHQGGRLHHGEVEAGAPPELEAQVERCLRSQVRRQPMRQWSGDACLSGEGAVVDDEVDALAGQAGLGEGRPRRADHQLVRVQRAAAPDPFDSQLVDRAAAQRRADRGQRGLGLARARAPGSTPPSRRWAAARRPRRPGG